MEQAIEQKFEIFLTATAGSRTLSFDSPEVKVLIDFFAVVRIFFSAGS